MTIRPYTDADKEHWDTFVAATKNAHFLFFRDFMEYHKDRFVDASQMVFDTKGKLTALLVANQKEEVLYAHQGLTFGGVLWQSSLKLKAFFEMMDALIVHLCELGFRKWIYRVPPRYQQSVSCDELQTALFYLGATRIKTELCSVIDLTNFKWSRSKQYAIRKAQKESIRIRKLPDWTLFEPMLRTRLQSRYGISPVHTKEEMLYLMTQFPENISVYGAFYEDELLAGVTLFDNHFSGCVHAQYITSKSHPLQTKALDLLFSERILAAKTEEKRYFSLGISSEDQGNRINAGLTHWKERWGAAPFLHETYQIDLKVALRAKLVARLS
ncbi:MAG: hypothetical protein AAF740_00700 [Bacteroidota bacterium]